MHKQILRYTAVFAIALTLFASEKNANALSAGLSSASVEEARRHPRIIDAVDAHGDTLLGQALKAEDHDLALELLRRGTRDVLHINTSGESYVFLAAKAGFPDVIRTLADRRYSALHGLSFFHFEDLDRPNLAGENAFFVARNSAVLDELITEYVRGSKWYAGSYVRQINKAGENFLHVAAREDRSDVALWATQYLCRASSWSERGWLPVRYGSRALSRVYGALQTYTPVGRIPLEGAMLFNQADLHRSTPLHVAVAKQNWETARALAGCKWLDYDRSDEQGNRPVQTMLAGLDPEVTYDADTHTFFHFLLAQNTSIRRWLTTPVDRVNHRNRQGDTALHLAARLKDRYFFDAASAWGNIEAVDKQGRTAADQRRLRDRD